ncbi:MAG: class I SAM-dependent methyltransferase [Campylobacter sputorum]|uniref:class I SAM-dependent methyltransferase n=1 Tax=Campylobacter sputorum TaxID=206 RepID=UPI000B793FFB|nr:class I SAM-dependent methyltransferase [Campylobacter sputorum]ASM37627.1 SAM-dependent methyltransferase [Campylobacter sputorum bv. paraureolyticus LMG 11764]MDY6121358.1 class I SAM-dependent methyltransferase [Campylobacter sputorum]
MQNLWDKKAKTYNRFDGKLSKFGKVLFDKLNEFKINFNDKNILDIGCGTGVYSLYLAGICKFVTCLDSSNEMLKCLKDDANKFNIKNIKIINLPFDEFYNDKKFDIAFLTMSPSLKNEKDFDKFISLGKEKIYLNWQIPRYSSLIEPFLKDRKIPNYATTANELEAYLKNKNISYKTHIFDEKREVKRDFNSAYENILWHLQINKIDIDELTIKRNLQKTYKDDIIIETIISKMKLLVF